MHIKFFHNTHHTQLHKKRSTDTYTGRCENMWLILKRNRKCQCHIWTSCWWRFAHFDLAPDSTINNTTSSENLDVTEHPLFLIVNWIHDYHGLFFFSFQKSKEIFIKWQKVLISLIWYFDFWKLMDDGSLSNLKILNLILSKILKLNVGVFQNYFYKIKVSKLKWK